MISGALLQLRTEFDLNCQQTELVVSALMIGALIASITGGLYLCLSLYLSMSVSVSVCLSVFISVELGHKCRSFNGVRDDGSPDSWYLDAELFNLYIDYTK